MKILKSKYGYRVLQTDEGRYTIRSKCDIEEIQYTEFYFFNKEKIEGVHYMHHFKRNRVKIFNRNDILSADLDKRKSYFKQLGVWLL